MGLAVQQAGPPYVPRHIEGGSIVSWEGAFGGNTVGPSQGALISATSRHMLTTADQNRPANGDGHGNAGSAVSTGE